MVGWQTPTEYPLDPIRHLVSGSWDRFSIMAMCEQVLAALPGRGALGYPALAPGADLGLVPTTLLVCSLVQKLFNVKRHIDKHT